MTNVEDHSGPPPGDVDIGAVKVACVTRQLLWTDELVAQLTVLAEIFANAVTRKRTAHAMLVSSTALQTARTEART